MLLSIGKNLNLTTNNNLLVKFINNVFRNEEKDRENITADSAEIENNAVYDKVASTNTENKDKLSSTTNNEQNRIFEGISKDWYGIKVITQNDNIVSKYYKFTIHNTTTSKKLGDFNYCDDLGHVDKDGNTVDGYSYFIISATIECLEEDRFFEALSLKNLQILFYNGIKREGGIELLTANNDVPMNSKSAMMVKMKKGEKRDFNLVFLVEDKFINDKAVDFYLYINENGSAPGTNDEYKSLVKLDYRNTSSAKDAKKDEKHIFNEISKQQYGIKVVTQNDVIETAYNRYTINKISTSKKLGDFNYSDDLGHVDKDGNAIDGYSYFIVNTSLECLDVDEVIGGFYLNTIDILVYKDTIQQTGYEMLSSNNDVPMSNKSAFKVKMKKGEKRDFNLVFLVEDKFINDKAVDFYLYINENGSAQGTNDKYKSLVKLDYRNTSSATDAKKDEKHIFNEISKQQYGIKVVAQNDVIETAYNRYTINKISTSKKLGDFNYSDNLGHVDKTGNAIDGYSYFIVNTSLECLDVDEVIGGFYLNTIHILAYKDTIQQTGYEMLTSNNDVPMSNKSAFKVKMKKGEIRDFNLVFLVEDKFINDKSVDFYLDINDRGASPGSDDENKRIVKLDYVR